MKLNETALKRTKPTQRAEFEELALPYLDSIYRTALWMARNTEDAEDLVQETFLRAYRAFGTFQKGSNFRAWLFTILHNANINRFRKNKGAKKVNFDDVEPFLASRKAESKVSDTGRMGDYSELLDEEVKHAVDDLPECFRLPVLLSALEDMNYKDISRVLDCPIGTVMSRISRGRQALRGKLADYARGHGYALATS